IDAYREKPIAETGSAGNFRKELEDWKAMTPNIFIWDYTCQFTNYLAPFPYQSVLQANVKYFKDNRVTGIFEHGSGDTYGDMAELQSYLQAKLLWDPEADRSKLTEEFCKGYYGPAAPSILEYLRLREEALLNSGKHLDIYGTPANDRNGYLSPEHMDAYDRLIRKAAGAVDGTVYQQRIARVRLSLEYAILQQSRVYGNEKHGFLQSGGTDRYIVKANWPQRVKNFAAECKKAGVRELSENGLSPARYQQEWENIFNRKWPFNLASNAKVTLLNPFAEDYPARGARTLVDGMTGFDDYSYNWLCFYGTDLIATLDMGKEIAFRNVSMNFLNDPRHSIYPPVRLTVETSDDGVHYVSYGLKPSDLKAFESDAKTNESVQLGAKLFGPEEENLKVRIRTFVFDPKVSCRARFIRVTAKVLPQQPSWRSYSNKKPMLCCDEIYVLP
ncbi:MAG: DUF4838 domain-containing protein, partial [Bacteroidota bacterium]|nr:DUF4838 domain-containing protein [Bacteroidota bacterium]